MIALADCNNFYVSCERVFNPRLKNKPVIVLSNNDGCIISRSNEAKMLGIKMGEPVFKIKKIIERYDIQLFSTNFALYGDMSSRVMQLLNELSPKIEVYSIDEAFIDFKGIQNQNNIATSIVKNIKKSTGIPISIGIAKTKTLAKIANHIAKKENKSDICILNNNNDIMRILKRFPVSQVWGIGSKSSIKLNDCNIYSAYDFTLIDEKWILKNMSITGLQIQKELKGYNCFKIDTHICNKKNISSSRTFATKTNDFDYISKHISRNASRCAQKLRIENSSAGFIGVSLQTSPYDKNQKYHQSCKTKIIDSPSNDTIELVKISNKLMESMYLKNIHYNKARVFVGNIVPSNKVQLNLFQNQVDRSKLYNNIDFINRTMGMNTIQILSDGIRQKNFKKYISSRFTTRWDELLKIRH